MLPRTELFVGGLVLGPGGSERPGGPKQLLPYGEGMLLAHVVSTADEVRPQVGLDGAEVVVNEAYGEGCSSSIAAALGALHSRCDVLVLMLGDQPGVSADTVARLLGGRGESELAVCRYEDGGGHPLALGRGVFGQLAELYGDKGVWRMLDRPGVAEVPLAGPMPRDVDTPEDYEAVPAS